MGLFHADRPEIQEEIEKYIESLENFMSFVTYSDSFVLPLKIIILIILKVVCCGNKNKTEDIQSNVMPVQKTQRVCEI